MKTAKRKTGGTKTSSAVSVKPNLFIVGSMKCGTSILHDFLTSHPKISGGTQKEIHYFSMHHHRGENWYTGHFSHDAETKYYLESSPTYFDMSLKIPTAERIRKFSPDAKIIILLREPVRRAVSHFNHLKKVNKLSVLDGVSFDELISRNWDPSSDSQALENIRSMLLDFSSYGKKIVKFIEIFGRENVFVINNDDLSRHGKIVVSAVFDFLGLEAMPDADFTEKKYVHGSDKVPYSARNHVALLQELGDDYYTSCRMIDALRPLAPTGAQEFNQPVGALVSEVGVGEEGWLFLASGSNNVIEMYLQDEEEHVSICRQWHEVVRSRKHKLADMGARYVHMMIPEKITALGDKLHWPIDHRRSWGSTFASTAPSDLRPNIIDYCRYLRNLGDASNYYYKTDSHWNHNGAFLAYQLVLSTLGIPFRADLLSRQKNSSDILFDLGSKLPDRPLERAIFQTYRAEAEILSENELIQYKRKNKLENLGALHVGSCIRFRNEKAPEDKKVIIFGDSFSEYRDHLLTALMAETFRETMFVWSTSLDYKLCGEFKPDIVFGFMTERFMSRVAEDNFDVQQFAAKRMAELGTM